MEAVGVRSGRRNSWPWLRALPHDRLLVRRRCRST